MEIGTITFHWATNYGAVLQSFALQQYLITNGYETELINYIPFRVKFRQVLSDIKNVKLNNFIKEYRINRFRKQYLILSKKTYYKNYDLMKKCHDYDQYICGSDQVWNEWFILHAESKQTLSYYLNFVMAEKNRISYATSFGTDYLSKNVADLVKPELEKFKSLSIRENTGKSIIESLGLQATLVVDPTLLLDKENYEELFKNKENKIRYQFFPYILHEKQTTAQEISNYIFNKHFNKLRDKKYDQEPIGIIEWLYSIKNAKFVLTNSFHGAIFSIIFHTPFVVVPVKNSSMNNRIITLLEALHLSDRIIHTIDEAKIDYLLDGNINWYQADERIKALRIDSINFLKKALEK